MKTLYLLILGCLASCASGPEMHLKEMDLLEYGVPITIQVPDSAEIKALDFGVQKDVSIVGDSWYKLQIFNSRTSDHNMTSAIAGLKSIVEDGAYFSRFVKEDPDGFIFEMMFDSILNYDFRHLKIQGDHEYLFQAGMSGSFKEDEVEKLYQIAKDAR